MLSEIEQVLPSEIEKRSFEIITEELKEMGKILCPETELIVKRCIHTSADFEYADSLVFTEGVVEKAKDAIRRGVPIITDTQMGKAGINKKRLAEYGSEVLCFMSDEDVAEMAKKNGTTRAVASMDKAAALGSEWYVECILGHNTPDGFQLIPEPATATLGLLGLAALMMRRRR